jgi:hypothetical protein
MTSAGKKWLSAIRNLPFERPVSSERMMFRVVEV